MPRRRAVAPIAELSRAGQDSTLLPGLWLQWVSVRREDVVSGVDFSISSGADSQEFQEMAWEMFRAVGNGTETNFADAAVVDVTKARYPLEEVDYMESFWLAETLKSYYLALSPPGLISLDDLVLDTEAHRFRRLS
ncbi:hypothetical protein SLS53_006879 [Cytospora paraplurivora]|uniref:Alpha-1,2-Mannosidase n=1 Tax=Cytospora paraplurivora TaxID=2898453 RepID=A0AAN9U1W5_9PEZI